MWKRQGAALVSTVSLTNGKQGNVLRVAAVADRQNDPASEQIGPDDHSGRQFPQDAGHFDHLADPSKELCGGEDYGQLQDEHEDLEGQIVDFGEVGGDGLVPAFLGGGRPATGVEQFWRNQQHGPADEQNAQPHPGMLGRGTTQEFIC